MITLGIIGLGNVALEVHLPILLARSDIKITWIFDKLTASENICKKKNIPFYNSLDSALKFKFPEIVLITTPYNQRKDIFNKIKNKVSGVYCEKPFALTQDEHMKYIEGYNPYSFTIGYQKRSLGNVRNLKNIISSKIFNSIKEISVEFGDVHYAFGGSRSKKEICDGGIFFESGSEYIDTVLYLANANKIDNFNSQVKYIDALDVHSEGDFDIYDDKNELIKCKFKFSSIKNTENKIIIKFENCFIELYLYEDDFDLILNTNNKNKFSLGDYATKNYPNDLISQHATYWENFLNSFKNKKHSYSSVDNFLLISKIIELYYAK